VDFWQCVFEDKYKLANIIERYYPLSLDGFKELQSKQMEIDGKYERAANYYVLNRASFSGSTLSGGMSKDHPRFTPSSIERVKSFSSSNVRVKCLDFNESINIHNDMFLYLDPPYMIKNYLYGNRGNAHKNFDHLGLHRLLSKRKGWILSYNNCPEIRELYGDYKVVYPEWSYGMSKDKESKEILVLNI
jgi:DNA adenine methylase